MSQRSLLIDLQSDLLTAVLQSGAKSRTVLDSAVVVLAGREPVKVIQELTDSLDCTDCCCSLAFGTSFFLFRNIELPFSDRKSIDKVLPLELEESLAGSVDSMVLDTLVNPGEGKEVEIICAMIGREMLSTWHTAFLDAGIILTRITVSGLSSIAGILENGQPPEEFVFLALRTEDAALFLVSEKKLQLIRPLPFKPLGLESTSKPCFTADQESGELTFQGGAESGEAYSDLALAVRQTLLPMPLKTDITKIPLYIEGSGIQISVATSWIKEAFSLPCFICGKGGILPLPPQLPKRTEAHGYYLTSALSLGAQKEKSRVTFNFCKDGFAPVDSMAKYRVMGKALVLFFIVALIASATYLVYNNGIMQKERDDLVADIHNVFTNTMPEVKRIVDPVQQLQVAINSAKASSGEDGGARLPFPALHVLRELSVRIPVSLDVRLKRFVYEAKGLRLIGITDTFNTVDSVKKSLEQSPDITSVTISSTNMNPKDNKIRFELKVGMEASEK